jgi:hypothetical protein
MESLYWVFTHNCNLRCAHCYNSSRPGAPTVTREEADAVFANLPASTNRFILSGGEPLVEPEMLHYLIACGRERYPETWIAVQTNGDLLDAASLARLRDAGVDHISVASQDAFHPRPDGKFDVLRALLSDHGFVERDVADPATPRERRANGPDFSVWGASPELWVGGIWPRGRAMKYGLAQLMPEHNFCDIWSGALGFLDDHSPMQEIAIQLTTAYPCCPGTVEPLGDLAREPLEAMLERHRGDPVWEALSAGDPEGMGAKAGVSRAHARRRIRELGSVCLWCDEFFTERARKRGTIRHLPVMGEKAVPQP